jgi:hypothetical protein
MTDSLADVYRSDLHSDDPVRRSVAERQLARLRSRVSSTARPSETGVATGPLPRLVERVVGPLHEKSNGNYIGRCPWHSSRSGRCLVVFTEERRWWCSSCRRGGDIVAWLSMTRGMGADAARRHLGLPRLVRRPRPHVEVVSYAR